MLTFGVTGDDLFAEILMLRTADSRTVVLVEGPSDCQALDAHVDSTAAYTLPGYSKTAVEVAIHLVDSADVERVLAILDLDWVGILENPMASANVVYTDRYDLDATIFLSGDVLTRVVASTTDRERLKAYLKSADMTLRDAIVRIAGKVGVGRLVSCRDGLEVTFRDFPVHVALSASNDDVDVVQLVTVALGRSSTSSVDQTKFVAKVKSAIDATHELDRCCCGHDIAATIAHLVRTCWGGNVVSRATMEKFGKAALSCAALQQTILYAKVADWGDAAQTRVWSCT
jgi:hypothetical protein